MSPKCWKVLDAPLRVENCSPHSSSASFFPSFSPARQASESIFGWSGEKEDDNRDCAEGGGGRNRKTKKENLFHLHGYGRLVIPFRLLCYESIRGIERKLHDQKFIVSSELNVSFLLRSFAVSIAAHPLILFLLPSTDKIRTNWNSVQN